MQHFVYAVQISIISPTKFEYDIEKTSSRRVLSEQTLDLTHYKVSTLI